MKTDMLKRYVENEEVFYNRKIDIEYTKETELEFEIVALEEKLKKARAKIRMQNKIIEALTK
tara:strand:+ start:1928 stop:2113 length:186 start_codon:yes stop_codon:yes gene_type:complete